MQTSCKFLAGIEMYVLRDTIKNKRCYLKKNRNLATELKHLFFLMGQKPATDRGYVATSNGKSIAMSLASGDGFIGPSLPVPPTFSPPKQGTSQGSSLIPSLVATEFHNSVAKCSATSENLAAFSIVNSVVDIKIQSLISLIPSLIPSLFDLFL